MSPSQQTLDLLLVLFLFLQLLWMVSGLLCNLIKKNTSLINTIHTKIIYRNYFSHNLTFTPPPPINNSFIIHFTICYYLIRQGSIYVLEACQFYSRAQYSCINHFRLCRLKLVTRLKLVASGLLSESCR